MGAAATMSQLPSEVEKASVEELQDWFRQLDSVQKSRVEQALGSMSTGEVASAPEAAAAKGMEILIKRLEDAEPMKLNVQPRDTVADVKSMIQELLGISPLEQKLVVRKKPLEDDRQTLEEYGVAEGALLLLLVVEVPAEILNMTIWDVESNERKEQLTGDGSVLSAEKLRQDYISVVAKEPIRSGKHYFQFVCHCIEDEEWIGVTAMPDQANKNPYPTNLLGWLYYCGRMRGDNRHGGLQCMKPADSEGSKGEGIDRKTAAKVKPTGDIVGMAIDIDKGEIAFDVNGVTQGGDRIPPCTPMWILTTVDRPGDKIEVRKVPLSQIPEASQGIMADNNSVGPWGPEEALAYAGSLDNASLTPTPALGLERVLT